MLTPDQIEALRLQSEDIIDPVVQFLIGDIAQRISEAGHLTSTAAYQVWRLQHLGVSQRQLKKELRKLLKVSHRDLRKLLTQTAEVGYNYDIQRFPYVQAVPFERNEDMQRIVEAAVKLAEEDLGSLTQTLGFVAPNGKAMPLTDAYREACDFAFKKVFTGAQDYNSAVREATKGLVDRGILRLDYDSGVHRSVEAAVRGSVMGGLGLLQEQISQQNHDDLGCNGWEISAHANSAPDHEPIQGKQYSDEEYERLNNSLQRQIGTLNCGHSASPIIMGIHEPQYTPEELEKFREDNEKGITYNGKHYTMYEATQRQRLLERKIRKVKRRILVDEKLGDTERLSIDRTKYVVMNDEYKRFSKAAGLRVRHERMEMTGFGPKQHGAAESGYAQRVAEVGEAAATHNWYSIPVAGGQTETKYRKIKKPSAVTKDAENRIIDENVRATNPGYKNGGPEYRQNCQRCVAAYEMRRRGYDVIARKAVVNENGLLSRKDPLYFKWDKIFHGIKFLRCKGPNGGIEDIIAKMEMWGDGSVSEVHVQWSADKAHVFIAERVGGVVRFLDPQTGNTDYSNCFTNAVNGATMIARIDNLEPTELIELCIKNRGGK